MQPGGPTFGQDECQRCEEASPYCPGTTALHLAVKARNCTLASLLLGRGAEPSPAMRRDGWTPLHIATSRRNNVQMVKILTDHGADINAQ